MIQRGVTVFKNLLFEEVEELPHRERSGRHPELHEARNRYLFFRFYFKSKIQRRLYSDVLLELEAELFISRTMIQKILQANAEQILLIKKQQPTLQWLRKEYPFVNW